MFALILILDLQFVICLLYVKIERELACIKTMFADRNYLKETFYE